MNQVYTEVCVETEALQVFISTPLTAGTASYTLAASVLRIKQMYVTPVGGTQSRPLEPVALEQILEWRQGAGGTVASTGSVGWYAMAGLNQFEVYPTPAGADTITMWYVKLPTALSANGDVPSIPEPYVKAIEYGACEQAAEFKRDQQNLQYYGTKYTEWKGKLRGHLGRIPSAIPQQMKVFGTPAVRPHDPSTDLGY